MFATFQACRRHFFFRHAFLKKKYVDHFLSKFGQDLSMFVNTCPTSINICQCTVLCTYLPTIRYCVPTYPYRTSKKRVLLIIDNAKHPDGSHNNVNPNDCWNQLVTIILFQYLLVLFYIVGFVLYLCVVFRGV